MRSGLLPFIALAAKPPHSPDHCFNDPSPFWKLRPTYSGSFPADPFPSPLWDFVLHSGLAPLVPGWVSRVPLKTRSFQQGFTGALGPGGRLSHLSGEAEPFVIGPPACASTSSQAPDSSFEWPQTNAASSFTTPLEANLLV